MRALVLPQQVLQDLELVDAVDVELLAREDDLLRRAGRRVGGRPGGPAMPYQFIATKPGRASCTAGVAGLRGQRSAAVTASRRTWPCSTAAQAELSLKKMSAFPAITSARPRSGT